MNKRFVAIHPTTITALSRSFLTLFSLIRECSANLKIGMELQLSMTRLNNLKFGEKKLIAEEISDTVLIFT